MVHTIKAAALALFHVALAIQDVKDVNGKAVRVLGDVVPMDTAKTYWSQLEACPKDCSDPDPLRWNVYSSLDELKSCNDLMLLDFALSSPVGPGHTAKIRACKASDNKVHERAEQDKGTCLHKAAEKQVAVQSLHQGDDAADTHTMLQTLEAVQRQIGQVHCTASTFMGYVNNTIVGVYAGKEVDKTSVAKLIGAISSSVREHGASTHAAYQVCDKTRNANHVLGISIATEKDLVMVQKDMAAWKVAKCVEGATADSQLGKIALRESTYPVIPSFNGTEPIHSNITARGTCRTIDVVPNDSCGTLASRCGISGPAFEHFNPGDKFCSKLMPYQRVCCSSGGLPDIRPVKNSDGSCSDFLVVDQTCSQLAAHYGFSVQDLEKWNKGGVWGWSGCEKIRAGDKICLSEGSPPMPAPYENAICGPVKPGTEKPTGDVKLEDLNPCPLNACCNIWGQCGISGDFCKDKRGPTGNPGTAPPGVDGCISSCGTEIVGSGKAPPSFGRVGYYETWNFDRPCLNLKSSNANNANSYTILHWAFAEINTNDWSVHIRDDYKQWQDFKSLQRVKKVISFGGWGYSTEPETYDILRKAMSPANRDQFAKNVADFVHKEGLDGVDFDWEYPGAPDIPGTPPGLPDDGINYFNFLAIMRKALGIDRAKTLSIAAPASYWYLKQFPIKKMALALDYIVYMTYDLHGQWDVGNKYSSEGCPEGNCLRSHVNLTETKSALAMITKAGVPTFKIFVGESSYGRSFKMEHSGCIGPNCRYLGARNESPAKPGRCTGTGGYISNAEIQEIIDADDGRMSYHDFESNSDILVYEDTEWVAYMTEHTKDTRRDLWQSKNFAGTIDWAVDLKDFTTDDFSGPSPYGDDFSPPDYGDLEECKGDYDDLDKIPTDAPGHCKNLYILMSLRKIIQDTMSQYRSLVDGGYDKKFNTYADAVVRSGRVQIEKFMYFKGKDYFDCTVTEQYTCCEACYGSPGGTDKICRYCEKWDCGWDSICTQPEVLCGPIESRFRNISMACPPDFSERSEDEPRYNWVGAYALSTVYWNLRDDRKNAFYVDLFNDTGIQSDNLKWTNVRRQDCIPAEKKEDCWNHGQDVNFPVTDNYDREDIANPEEVISRAHDKLNGLADQLTIVIDQLKAGTYPGSSYDLVDAVSLTVQTAEDAVDNMQTIDDTVDEWEEEKRKNIILAFLTAIFLFIPVIGEFAAAFGAIAGATRIALLAGGAASNVALDVYSIVEDKNNIPLAIFGIVLEPLALLDVAKVARAANLRRSMKAEDVRKLHAKPGGRVDKIDEIKNLCPAKPTKRDLLWGAQPMSSLTGVTYHAVTF